MTINNDRMKVIDRIINLLAKAESTTFQAEAESARKMAAKLMANYEVKKMELDKDEKIIKITVHSSKSRRNMKHAFLYQVIAEYCGVYLVCRGTTYILCGKPKDIEAATYMFDVIWNQVSDMVAYWYKKNKANPQVTVKSKNNYTSGLIFGIQYNLDKINNYTFDYKKSTGLVPVNQNKVDLSNAADDFKRDNKVTTSSKKTVMDGSFNQGMSDSKNVSMRRGVSSKTTYQLEY